MTTTERVACAGCGDTDPTCPPDCCCEYTNLVSGRSHYCGQDSCYCRGLRRFMRRSVLDTFIPPGEQQ